MPNRIIKESITTSETLAKLTGDEERHFWRLIVQADDYGYLDARPEVVRAKGYAMLLDSVSAFSSEDHTLALVRVGLLHLFMADGKRYGHFPTWAKHQRVRASLHRYPIVESCDGNCNQLLASGGELPQVAANGGLNPNPNPNPNPKEKEPLSTEVRKKIHTHTEPSEEDKSVWPDWYGRLWDIPGFKVSLKQAQAWLDSQAIPVDLAETTAYSLKSKWPGPTKSPYRDVWATFQTWCRREKARVGVQDVNGAKGTPEGLAELAKFGRAGKT